MLIPENGFIKPVIIGIMTVLLVFPVSLADNLLGIRKAWSSENQGHLPPLIQFNEIHSIEPGEDIIIEAVIDSADSIVMTPTLYYRKKGEQRYIRIKMDMKGNKLYQAIIPGLVITKEAEGIEYYIEASDMLGKIASEGTAEAPLFTEVRGIAADEPTEWAGISNDTTGFGNGKTKDEQTRWYKKWWVWAIVVGVAGGAACVAADCTDNPTETDGSGSIIMR